MNRRSPSYRAPERGRPYPCTAGVLKAVMVATAAMAAAPVARVLTEAAAARKEGMEGWDERVEAETVTGEG